VSALGGASPPLIASDKSIYWMSVYGAGVIRSVDEGKTWTQVVGSGVVTSAHPVELPDGSIAALGSNYVMISSDHGATWSPASPQLPFNDATGLVYAPKRKAFYTWHFTCEFNGPVPVPDMGIMRYDFDYTKLTRDR
jgi:hypothetical protein